MKGSVDFLLYTILSVSSEDVNFPASNLRILESSTLHYRSLVTTQVTIVLDLGVPKLAPVVLLYNTNAPAVELQGNTSNTWGSPPFTSGSLSAALDPEQGIYKLQAKLTNSFNYRYMRIVIPAGTPTDGAAYFRLGILAIPEGIESFSGGGDQFEFPLEVDKTISETLNRFGTGRKDVIPLSDIPVLSIGLSGRFKDTIVNRTKVNKVFANPKKSTVYLDRETTNTWEFYIAQRTAVMQTPKITPNQRRVSVALETIL